MIQEISVFVCSDCSRFDDRASAEKYDAMEAAVSAAMSTLHPVPDASEFWNGKMFVQQDLEVAQRAKMAIPDICRERFPSSKKECETAVFVHPAHAFIGRVINDSNCKCLDRA